MGGLERDRTEAFRDVILGAPLPTLGTGPIAGRIAARGMLSPLHIRILRHRPSLALIGEAGLFRVSG